LVFLFLNL